MPMYDFRCRDCGRFEALVAMSEIDTPQPCPCCGVAATRLVSVPRLAVLSPGARQAHETNERSAHEPRLRRRHFCCSGGHCSHQNGDSGRPAALKTSASTAARPWMLGH